MGLLNGSTPSAEITRLFEHSSGYRWTAAAVGANNAAGYQFASGQAIMAIGGFNGTDPTPTLAQFQQYVQTGAIHYFIGGRRRWRLRPGAGTARAPRARSTWVEQNFTARTVGGTTIYDLSPKATGAAAEPTGWEAQRERTMNMVLGAGAGAVPCTHGRPGNLR